MSEKSYVEVELKRIDVEFEKWKIEQENKLEAEKEKWKAIREMVIPFLKKVEPVMNSLEIRHREPTLPRTITLSPYSFFCPKCLEKGTQTVIDVSQMPEVAKCPICKAEYPRAYKNP